MSDDASVPGTLDALIREKSLDPFGFEELVDAWNDAVESGDTDASGDPIRSPGFEAAVDEALTAIGRESDSQVVGPQLRRMIAAFDHAALVTSPTGTIVTLNERAMQSLDALPGTNIDGIGFELLSGRPLSAEIAAAHDGRNSGGEVALLRAVSPEDGRAATLAIAPALVGGSRTPSTLVFIIDPAWHRAAEPLIARSFQLTEAECRVLTGFLDGLSLAEIAQKRRRSLKTVRTQFQTIMSKTGARNQAELMRNMLALSQFMGDVEMVADVAAHPFRKHAHILRPGGRTAEVFLAGDLDGDLVVVIPNVTMRTFTAQMEARFRRAGLCVATLCRPGYGGTDPPPQGTDANTCLAGDYVALLDQLGAARAVVMAQNTGTGFAFGMAGLVPARVARLVIVSALPPHHYLDARKTRSPLAAAFIRARFQSRSLFRLLMMTAVRAWKIGGARRVHAMQLASWPPDLDHLKAPEVVAELDDAMRSRFAQGLDQIAADFELATSDWGGWVAECPVLATILHGAHDQSVPLDVVRQFVADFPETLSLVEMEDAGFLAMHSHTDFVIETLRAAGSDSKA